MIPVRARSAAAIALAGTTVLPGCQAGPGADLVLANVTIIDGRGGPPVPGQTIEIQGGKIVKIRPAREGETGTLEAAGQFVIPGLFDSHVHIGHDPAVRVVLDTLLMGGVTSIREMACCASVFQSIDSQSDSTSTPRIFYSAFWADSAFFAGDPRVRAVPDAGRLPWFLGVDSATNLVEAVRRAGATGATGIKIYSNLGPRLVAAIVAEGHAQGMRVWSHPVIFPTRPSAVIEAGVDVISHASLLVWEGVETLPGDYNSGHPFNAFGPPAPFGSVPPDAPAVIKVLEAMRQRGTILDATLSTVRGAVSEAAFAWGVQVTARAHKMGIPIAAGTDRGEALVNGRPVLLEELQVLVKDVGLTPLQAIATATLTAARVVGREKELGSIEAGKVADLVILGSDPTADIQRLADVRQVIKGGRRIAPRRRAGYGAGGRRRDARRAVKPHFPRTTPVGGRSPR